jgi:inner membrane protein
LDSLTHTVLGAVVGEAIAGKKLGKQAMFWGALANNFPDVDVITSLWMTQADSLLAHRGFTHSILFALLFSPLFAYVILRFHKNKQMNFRDWLYIIGSGIFIHIFIDALTCYGTGWYEPFHHHRVTMNVLFVADPFYTISLLISFVALLVLKPRKSSRSGWVKFGLVVSTLYVVYAFFNKAKIDSEFKTELARQNISYSNYFTTPTPLNNFLWFLVAKNDTGYFMGYRSFFDSKKDIELNFRNNNISMIENMKGDVELNKLIRFSKGYYTLEVINDTLIFNDIRFGTIGGWEDPSRKFVFRYSLEQGANNDVLIQKGRMESSGKDALMSLWDRVCGN